MFALSRARAGANFCDSPTLRVARFLRSHARFMRSGARRYIEVVLVSENGAVYIRCACPSCTGAWRKNGLEISVRFSLFRRGMHGRHERAGDYT